MNKISYIDTILIDSTVDKEELLKHRKEIMEKAAYCINNGSPESMFKVKDYILMVQPTEKIKEYNSDIDINSSYTILASKQ